MSTWWHWLRMYSVTGWVWLNLFNTLSRGYLHGHFFKPNKCLAGLALLPNADDDRVHFWGSDWNWFSFRTIAGPQLGVVCILSTCICPSSVNPNCDIHFPVPSSVIDMPAELRFRDKSWVHIQLLLRLVHGKRQLVDVEIRVLQI